MPHCDPETLALRALGEPIPAEDEVHLSGCAECREDLETLEAVVGTGRAVTAEDAPVAPSPQVWDRIADQLGLAPDGPDVAGPTPSAATEGPVAEPVREASTGGGRADRRALWLVAAAAAVVGLVLGGVAVGLATRDQPGTVVASTALAPVDGSTAHGSATLRSTSTGRTLEVDVQDLPATDGYFEVWFMNAETGGAVSLGSLDPDHPTTLDVPQGLVVADFPYVDVSVEPLDGDPAHSSVSIARGPLEPPASG